jgi:hypothetical protein
MVMEIVSNIRRLQQTHGNVKINKERIATKILQDNINSSINIWIQRES